MMIHDGGGEIRRKKEKKVRENDNFQNFVIKKATFNILLEMMSSIVFDPNSSFLKSKFSPEKPGFLYPPYPPYPKLYLSRTNQQL